MHHKNSLTLFTIGHSTHSVEYFIGLLKKHDITAVCDVRSQPYSQFNPQFNRESLKEELRKNDIGYVFLGKELGARSENQNCYIDGKVQYNYLVDEPSFKQGIKRICRGMKQYSIALMCAEKDPITCHRMILVCREMRSIVGQINHILENGEIETNSDSEIRLMNTLKIVPDMFKSKSECIEDAYDLQGQRVAYVEKEKQATTG